ncbi:MAG: hypothetical protein KGR16_04950 [Verrucomicrobia bacterium]|nr:hypothetical protein [Verrucomicrobiota bacterium]MDE3046890.1 hypothetical protein [Verrucomicrobiota bacterium]
MVEPINKSVGGSPHEVVGAADELKEVISLDEVKVVMGRIREQWNDLSPGQLADAAVDLEDRVKRLSGDSAQVRRIRALAQHMRFQVVFPLTSEFDQQPHTFAYEVDVLRKKVLNTESLDPLSEFNRTQQEEILRYARGR